MDFPKLRKNLRSLLTSIGRVGAFSKNLTLSAGLITFASGQPANQPKAPIDPKLSEQKSEISRYSSKYLLKSAANSLSRLFAQHRSHSSHSSHASHSSHYSSGSGHQSHSSHASHYSSSSPAPPQPSHSSHYSASSTPAPIRSSPSSPSLRVPPPAAQPPTTSTVVLSDYFDDRLRAVTKWRLGCLTAGSSFTDSAVKVVEENARLEITPRAGIPGRSYNGYITLTSWDFTAAHARVDVFQTTNGTADTIFAIGKDSDNWYGFIVENGKLYLQSKIKGRKNSQDVPYDAIEHTSWRLRHEASMNEILWETSADGETWTVRRRVTPQIPLEAIYVTLAAGTYLPEAEPGMAAFDKFRLVVHR